MRVGRHRRELTYLRPSTRGHHWHRRVLIADDTDDRSFQCYNRTRVITLLNTESYGEEESITVMRSRANMMTTRIIDTEPPIHERSRTTKILTKYRAKSRKTRDFESVCVAPDPLFSASWHVSENSTLVGRGSRPQEVQSYRSMELPSSSNQN